MLGVVGQKCCLRFHRAISLIGLKVWATTATGCANGRNMQHRTMLGVVGQQCYVRLLGALRLCPVSYFVYVYLTMYFD